MYNRPNCVIIHCVLVGYLNLEPDLSKKYIQ